MRQLPSLPKILAVAIASTVLWLPVARAAGPAGRARRAPKAEKSGPHPRAVVAEPVVDLGEVTYGESRTLEFVIKNTGDDVLRIHAAKSQCACAVIDFTPEVAPGAEGKIAVRFDAALSGGPSAVPIEVVSNDPDEPDPAAHHQGRHPLLRRCAAGLRALRRGAGLRGRQHGEADAPGHRRQPDAHHQGGVAVRLRRDLVP